MSEWKTIDSAPRDRKVLLYWPRKVAGAHGGNVLREMIEVGYANGAPHRQPTHWMPLPPPPVQEEEGS